MKAFIWKLYADAKTLAMSRTALLLQRARVNGRSCGHARVHISMRRCSRLCAHVWNIVATYVFVMYGRANATGTANIVMVVTPSKNKLHILCKLLAILVILSLPHVLHTLINFGT